jgi:hypothetical protein
MFKINENVLSFYGSFGKDTNLKYPNDIVIYDNEIFIHDSKEIYIYDKSKYIILRIFNCESFYYYNMAVDEHFIFITNSINTVTKINKKTLSIIDHILFKGIADFAGIALSDNDIILVNSNDNNIIVVDKESKKIIRTIQHHNFIKPLWTTIHNNEIYCSSKGNNFIYTFKRLLED